MNSANHGADIWRALPAQITLRISPIVAADYARRGVFPDLVEGYHTLSKLAACALLEDAGEQRRGPPDPASRGLRTAYTSLANNLSRALGLRGYNVYFDSAFAAAADLERFAPFVSEQLRLIGETA